MATATEETIVIDIDDAQSIIDGAREAAGRSGLFDPEPYTLPVPRVDGTPADAIELIFSGKVTLDPLDERDLALIERLKLDLDYTLRVEAAVAGKAMKVKRTEEDTVATHGIALRVHTLYRDGEGDA